VGKFTKEEKIILLIIIFAAVAGVFINIIFSYANRISVRAPLYAKQEKINVNSAPAEILTRLPGIGEAYALRIIEYREKNGPFKSPEELMKVKGIGIIKYKKIRDFIVLDSKFRSPDSKLKK